MPVSVTMPRLGESVSEGTVTRWLKKAGERVEADEPLLEVSTDKVDTEIPSPTSGILTEIKVNEDETVDVGVELAIIDDGAGESAPAAAEAAPEPAPAAQAAPAAEPEPAPEPAPAAETEAAPEAAASPAEREAVAAESAPAPEAPQPQQQPQTSSLEPSAAAAPPVTEVNGNSDAYVTPLVRKLAAEHSVDLAAIAGTGVGGRIRKQDVLDAAGAPAPAAPAAAAAAAPAAPATTAAAAAPTPAGSTNAAPSTQVRGRTEPLSRLRKVIATRMVESLHISAQLTTVVEVDVTRIAQRRAAAKSAFEAREGVKLSFLPFFALATVEALKAHPNVNASIDLEAGTVTYHDAVHLGIAVDTDRGLLVPVINHAEDLNIGGLARKIADLAERTRSNKVSPDELGGGTFTLTNTGSRGALFDTPIINQPQVGILGTGAVVKRPVVVATPDLGETIAIRSMVYFGMSYDHRLVDGADAARFLSTIKARLEDGNFDSELGLA
jgi:pyruvate dehydrogenase E2 component (dihydrolipoamide acetyltransferase)